MIERRPTAFYAHGCYLTSMSKKGGRFSLGPSPKSAYAGDEWGRGWQLVPIFPLFSARDWESWSGILNMAGDTIGRVFDSSSVLEVWGVSRENCFYIQLISLSAETM